MRKVLQPYVNQYVLGKGWITDWEEMDGGVTRIYVSQPTLRKPNKHLLFEDQEVISTEHHLNFFIDQHWITCTDEWTPEKYKQVGFAGVVQHYTRSNGTHDFGIYPTPQSTLHNSLDKLAEMTEYIGRLCKISPETLGWTEQVLPPVLTEYSRHLEEAGDRLPTFNGTYDFYKNEINEWFAAAEEISTKIRSICSNRAMRRKHKVKSNFAAEDMSVSPQDLSRFFSILGAPSLAATT